MDAAKKKKAMNNRLLEPLKKALHAIGIELRYVKKTCSSDAFWQLCSRKGGRVLMVEMDSSGYGWTAYDIIGYDTLEYIWNMLCTRVYVFIVDEKQIENPYLSCKSLEEMMVKCDLLGEED